MNILVVDGQGGGIGRQLVEQIKKSFPGVEITAVGTNVLATQAMVKAGADHGATGENAVIVGCRNADIIAGPIGIVIADSLWGEITPAMAVAIGQSKAVRILIPMNQCNNLIAGVDTVTAGSLIRKAVEQIRAAIAELEPRNEIGRSIFTKDPEPLRKDRTYQYKHEPVDLLRALDMITERNNSQLPPPTNNFKGIVGKEPYPVTRKTGEIFRQLLLRGVEKLKNLFKGNKSRSEIVATFISILEMCKTGSVSLEGDTSGENPNVRLLRTEDKEGEA